MEKTGKTASNIQYELQPCITANCCAYVVVFFVTIIVGVIFVVIVTFHFGHLSKVMSVALLCSHMVIFVAHCR